MAGWVSFDGTPNLTPPSITILQNDAQAVVLNVKIHGMFSEDTTVEGITYQRIYIPQETTTSDIGKADIPILKRFIQIQPQSGTVVNITIIAETLFTNYYVFPFQTPVTDSGPEPPFVKDTIFYNTDTWYPAEITTKSGAAILKDLRVITLGVQPISFNSVQQKIIVKNELNVTISFEGSDPENTIPKAPEISDRSLDLMYDFMVLNYELQVDTVIPKGGLRGTWHANYIILTADQFYDALQPLVFWKTKKGCNITIKKLSEVPGYSGSDADTAIIRQFLKDLYLQQQPPGGRVDILLVGNEDAIPQFKGWDHPMGGTNYSDHYYACLVGNDELEDVALGRLCVTSSSQITTITDKIFAYERTPNSTWGKNRVFLVAASNSPCPPIYKDNKMYIRDEILAPKQIPYYERYETQANPIGIAGALNGSGFGLVNYRGHGLAQGWYHLGGSSIWHVWDIYNRLTNTYKYPIVLNITCNNAALREPVETIAEAWLNKENAGGVGAFGSTRPSYSDLWNPLIYNGLLDIKLFEYLYNPPPYHAQSYSVGGAIWAGRNLMVSCGDPYYMSMARSYLYLGDVDLTCWRDDWGDLQVTHPSIIFYRRETTFTVQVKRYIVGQWQTQRDAHVCIYKADEDIHIKTLTDNSGNANITIKPNKCGVIYITVTYSNCHPYESTCSVSDAYPEGSGPQEAEQQIVKQFIYESLNSNLVKDVLKIRFNSPDERKVIVNLYDIAGRLVERVFNGKAKIGTNEILVTSKALTAGIYFVQFDTEGYNRIEKFIWVR